MDLGSEDKKFLEVLSNNFAVCSIGELLGLADDLKPISVETPILKKLMAIFAESQAFFKKNKLAVPSIELLDRWKDLILEIPGSKLPEIEIIAMYIWNYLQMFLFEIIRPTEEHFQPGSLKLIERGLDNCLIAKKFKQDKAEAFFHFQIGSKYFRLFQFGPKNKGHLENALTHLEESIPLYEKLEDYPQLVTTNALISTILQKIALFYVDTNPLKFKELIESAYQYVMKGVEIAREKAPSELPGIMIDASASVSGLGRIQADVVKGKTYLEQSIDLAKEGLAKVDSKSKEANEVKEALYNNIGVAYSYLGELVEDPSEKMKNYNISLDNKFKGLEHAKKTGLNSSIIRDLSNIGQSYHKIAVVERGDPKKYRESLQKAIEYLEEALKFGEGIEVDPISEDLLLMAGEILSKIFSKMLLMEKDHDKNLDWLSKKLKQERRNIQLAKQWKVRPMRIANNCIAAANSINNITSKIDDVMIVRELYQEQINILLEASKILEELKTDNEKLVNAYRNICGVSQQLSRIQPSAQDKYNILINGREFGAKAFQLAENLESPYLMINICDNYGLLVHDIGHALEHSDAKKAKEFFSESIKIFQKGLEIAKKAPDSIASQAVLLDYVGGSYRDLANLAKEINTKKDYFRKSAGVKEESLVLFEEYKKAPFDTAVTADSLAITLQQLGRIEDDSAKAVEILGKAIKYTKRAEELFTQTRVYSKALRCKISTLIELEPNLLLHSANLEKNPEKRWDFVQKARATLEKGVQESKVSPVFRTLAEYLLWEYPQAVANGVEVGGFRVIWDATQEEINIINKSYERSVQFKLALLTSGQAVPISEVNFELELERDTANNLVANPLVKISFNKNQFIYLKIPSRIGGRMLERKTFRLVNPNPEPLTLQLTTKRDSFSATENHLTIVGERNIFIIQKKPVKSRENLAEIELLQEDVECLCQISMVPRFSGILCITNPDIKKWKYNLGACLIEGPLAFKDAPHLVETDFSPIIFMDEKGNLPPKFFKVESDMTTTSGSLVELNERYPRIVRKIFIFGEPYKEKPPYERIELLNLLKKQITNIATVNNPFSGITILTSDARYFDEIYPLIEREKAALAQHTDFLRLSQLAKLLEIIYIPEDTVLTELAHMAANIRWLTFETIAICDDPILAFLAVPWCRFTDAFILNSKECQTEKGKVILGKVKKVFVIGELKSEIPEFADKKVEYLAKDPFTLTYELNDNLKKSVDRNWEHFIDSQYRELFPRLRKEAFGESVIITSKQANNLSYLILAANYAAAKLSSILLIDRDEAKLKIEADLFKQLDLLTYREAATKADDYQKEMMNRLNAFSKALREKYFDEKYIKLLDQAKFISIITNIPLPLELMQYGEGNSLLSLEKSVGRLCSTTIEETSILIQYSVLQGMMQSSDVKKATIISPKYFDQYELYYGNQEAKRGASLLGKKRNLGEENVDILVDEKITKQQFLKQLEKNPWLFIHYIGHGDLIDRESAFMVQPSEYTELVPIKARDLPDYIAGQPVFIANACLSGRYQESADGLSGLVFEIIRRGAISFIGTLWEVNDLSSAEFISELYFELLDGKFLGDAIQKSRRSILDAKDPTYGAYILFGDPMARIR